MKLKKKRKINIKNVQSGHTAEMKMSKTIR